MIDIAIKVGQLWKDKDGNIYKIKGQDTFNDIIEGFKFQTYFLTCISLNKMEVKMENEIRENLTLFQDIELNNKEYYKNSKSQILFKIQNKLYYICLVLIVSSSIITSIASKIDDFQFYGTLIFFLSLLSINFSLLYFLNKYFNKIFDKLI